MCPGGAALKGPRTVGGLAFEAFSDERWNIQ